MQIEFAFAQARIQARLGQRLTSGAWQALEASQGLSHYLHALRGTSLKSWIRHVTEHADAHFIERSLREDWRTQVRDISTWVPTRWRAAVLWVRTLTDLPAVFHLLRAGVPQSWMHEDPVLRALAREDADARWQALQATEFAPIAPALLENVTPLKAWRAHWRSLWPPVKAQRPGLDKLDEVLAQHVGMLRSVNLPASGMAGQREHLERNLVRFLRSHRQLPVAVFSYLGLLALDLQRLRGGLARRALFMTVARE